MTKTVSKVFSNIDQVEQSLVEIEEAGVSHEDISVLTTHETHQKDFVIHENSYQSEGAVAGASAGGLTGVLLGSLGSATALAIPGLNIVVAGALVSALAGLGAGATAGGLLGALVGSGFHEDEAEIVDKELKKGGYLVAVQTSEDNENTIREILNSSKT